MSRLKTTADVIVIKEVAGTAKLAPPEIWRECKGRAALDMDRLFLPVLHGNPEGKVVSDVAGNEEIFPYVLFPYLTHPPCPIRVMEKLSYSIGRPLD